MKTNIKIKNEALSASRTATLCPIPGLYETLKEIKFFQFDGISILAT